MVSARMACVADHITLSSIVPYTLGGQHEIYLTGMLLGYPVLCSREGCTPCISAQSVHGIESMFYQERIASARSSSVLILMHISADVV